MNNIVSANENAESGSISHLDPLSEPNLRLLALIGDTAEYELAFVTAASMPEAVMLEATLLDLYEAEHGELPPENKRR